MPQKNPHGSRLNFYSALTVLALPTAVLPAAAADALKEVVVTAPFGVALARDRVPARAQSADAARIDTLQPLDLSDLLNRSFGSVSINHAQNNPLQPDLNFRGYTASPLLGLPQGLSVYANGVRQNETFGDTVNWDLLPLSSVDQVQLIAGPNPIFGLNSLGGALAVQLKNGFRFDGTQADLSAGSFGRRSASLQHGGTSGDWGYYGNIDYFEEDGWRDFSASDALRFHSVLSHRTDYSEWNLNLMHADSNLRGNGAAPAELLELDRTQVFTHPDITENRLNQIALDGSRTLSDRLTLSGNLFYRDLHADTFNGDATLFEECTFGADEFLVEEDFDDVNADDACSSADDADIELVLDQNNNPIAAEIDGDELNAVNYIGRRRQKSHGAALQLAHSLSISESRRNDFMVGAAFTRGDSAFDSVLEIAQLLADRSTSRTGILAQEFNTAVDSEVTTWSLYSADTLDLSSRVSLTLAGRYDNSRIILADRSGRSPELNGRHRFGRFNPSAGFSVRFAPNLTGYISAGQSSRTPTAVELACADENAPCSLPNAFLADPPLDEVVTVSTELGFRGAYDNGITWHAGVFQATNRDDILFQTTGGAQANVGFFSNVSDTRRRGIELELTQHMDSFSWSANYSLINATYENAFVVNSPNHPPFAELIVGENKLLVLPGSELPGIARHQLNVNGNWSASAQLRVGMDIAWRSGVWLRGDEINVMDRTDSYYILNLRGEYQLNDTVLLYARVENLLNEEYETFGLLGEPAEVFAGFEDPRFLGAGPPRGAWLGLRARF
jgi:iron complex outermembrane recepter protein